MFILWKLFSFFSMFVNLVLETQVLFHYMNIFFTWVKKHTIKKVILESCVKRSLRYSLYGILNKRTLKHQGIFYKIWIDTRLMHLIYNITHVSFFSSYINTAYIFKEIWNNTSIKCSLKSMMYIPTLSRQFAATLLIISLLRICTS